MPDEALRALGLKEGHIRAYLHLVTHGAQRASEVRRAVGLGESECARVLEALTEAGLVAVTLDKPPRYEALPPERAFDLEIRKLEEKCRLLAEARARAASILQGTEPTARIVQHVLYGRRQAAHHLRVMVQQARETILLVATRPRVVDDATRALDGEDLIELLQRKASEGIRIRAIVTFRNQAALDRVRPLLDQDKADVRHYETSNRVAFCVTDQRDLLFWTAFDADESPSAEKDLAVFTNAPAFVDALGTLFDMLHERTSDAHARHAA